MRVLLAVLLLSAVAVAEDKPKTFKEVKSAAEGGDKDAQFRLGVYYDGKGVRKDDTEAAKWYRKAAEQGLAKAQYNLGVMYANGEGVPKDYGESYAWFSISAAGGHKGAKEARAQVQAILTPEQLAAAQKRAIKLYKQINANKAK